MWCNTSISKVEEMDYFDYLAYRRDAFIDFMNRSEEGRKYLENAHRLTITEPDRESLRKQFG